MALSHPYFLLLSLFLSLKAVILAQNNTKTNHYIAAIIDSDTRIGKEQKTAIEIAIADFNNNYSAASMLSLTFRNSGGDPLRAATTAELLIRELQVRAIIGPSTWQEMALVADVGNRGQVPVLSLATAAVTAPLMSSRWPYLVRMGNNYSVQMRCIAAIVESYQWRRVIAIYEDSGCVGGDSSAVTLLSDALRSFGLEIETRYAFPPLSSLSDPKTIIREQLDKLKSEQCKVFVVVEMPLPLAAVIFVEAKQLGMMEKDYVWITTDGLTSLLDAINSSVLSSMEGVVGIKTYFDESNPLIRGFRDRFQRNFQSEYPEEENHDLSIYALRAYDTVSVVYRNLETNPTQGQKFVSDILASDFKGLSGEISFKDLELDNPHVFQIVNVFGKSYRDAGFWSPELGFTKKINGPSKALGVVLWPGGQASVPKGWATPTAAKPMKIGVPAGHAGFDQFVRVTNDAKRNVTEVSGFCIDVFNEVVKLLPYDLRYEFQIFNGSTYDDMVQEVYRKVPRKAYSIHLNHNLRIMIEPDWPHPRPIRTRIGQDPSCLLIMECRDLK